MDAVDGTGRAQRDGSGRSATPSSRLAGAVAALSRLVDRGARRPLLTVAAFAIANAAFSAVWIWRTRGLGNFDPDEAGYLANALSFQRSLSFSNPGAFVSEVVATTTAPLVPVLSVVFLTVGPRDPRAAMLVQPLFVVVLAVAVAGVAGRLLGPRWALWSGVVVGGLATTVLASQSYWFGLAAATFMTLAVWALLASDGLSNRWSWAFGVAVGLMLLSRTMTIGFLPGLALAALVLAGRDRRRLARLLGAAAVALAVAGPWWIERRDDVLGYLVDYGYGTQANEWGPGGFGSRLGRRVQDLIDQTQLFLPCTLLLLADLAIIAVRRRRSATDPSRSPAPGTHDRDLLAVGVVAAMGFLALVTTRNAGVWFDLPLVVLAIPLVAVVLARGDRRIKGFLAVWMVVLAVGSSINLRVVDKNQVDGPIAKNDERSEDRAQRSVLAQEWWALTTTVTDELAELTERGRIGAIDVTGNTFLFNSNTIELAAELDSWDARIGVPDTREGAATLAAAVEPDSTELMEGGEPKERVIVVVRHDGDLFTPDANWRALDELARAEGWKEVASHAMPTPGEVVILRHPDSG